MIRFQDLSLSFRGGPHVLDSVSLDVPVGRITAILGPSGCGKTTLLRVAADLINPGTRGLDWSGTVDGLSPGDSAMIFQDLGLLPWKTVEENIALPLRWRRHPQARQRTAALMDELGLVAHAKAWPRTLSGGLAQRTALARALALEPRVLLLDEPFSALDALTRERAQDLLWRLWTIHRPTILLVTHSVEEALVMGHRVVVMGGTRPGSIQAIHDLGHTGAAVLPGPAPSPWTDQAPDLRRTDPACFAWARTIRQDMGATG